MKFNLFFLGSKWFFVFVALGLITMSIGCSSRSLDKELETIRQEKQLCQNQINELLVASRNLNKKHDEMTALLADSLQGNYKKAMADSINQIAIAKTEAQFTQIYNRQSALVIQINTITKQLENWADSLQKHEYSRWQSNRIEFIHSQMLQIQIEKNKIADDFIAWQSRFKAMLTDFQKKSANKPNYRYGY